MMKSFPQSAADWRSAIEGKAQRLEAFLSSFPDWGQCPVCQKAYPDSLAPHIAGKDHWKKLWWKAEQKDQKELRQEWHNATATVIFDHLSGEVTRIAGEVTSPFTPETTPPPFLRTDGALALETPPVDSRSFLDVLRSSESQAPALGYKSPRPCQSELDVLWNQGRFFCDVCSLVKAKDSFHKTQQKYSLASRRCIQCVDEANTEAQYIVCDGCKQRLHRDDFSKSLRNSDQPLCKTCKEERDIELSKLICQICGVSQLRDAFRKKIDWDAPKCANCLELKEKREYEEWQQEREDEAARQAELREEMAEEELREHFQIRILKRMQDLQVPALFDELTSEIFEQDRKNWAQQLMRNILSKELDDQWRNETPSRDHASDKDRANAFKALEDAGRTTCQKFTNRPSMNSI